MDRRCRGSHIKPVRRGVSAALQNSGPGCGQPSPTRSSRPSSSRSLRAPDAFPSSSTSPMPGAVYPAAFLTESRLDAMALRRSEDAFVDELFAGVVALGAPLMAARFPARLSRPQPGALRTRPAHVRGPAAALRQHALDARRRRARHDPAHRRRRPGDLPRPPPRRRGGAPDRVALQALSPDAAPARAPHRPRLRPRGADRLPFDALDERQPRGRRQGRRRARRPLRHELRARSSPTSSMRPCAAAAIRWCATSPMPAASSPSITASRRCRPPRPADRDQPRPLHGRTARWRKTAGFKSLADDLAAVFAGVTRGTDSDFAPPRLAAE